MPFNLDIRSANQAKEASLIFNHGREAYAVCARGSAQDKLNPYLLAKYLREAEYCLAEQNMPSANCSNGKIDSAGTCITIDVGCKERYGEFSYATGNIVANNNECECVIGYSWNENKTKCVEPCPTDLVYYSIHRDAKNNIFQGFCQSPDAACQSEFGEYSKYLRTDDYGRIECQEVVTVAGYEASEEEINYAITIERERKMNINLDMNLSKRLSGRILLQVEEKGEAWYVNPVDNYRYYLASPEKALEVMRELGLGATHEFISNYKYYPTHVLGKILIDVDDLGKAYYINPVDKKAYYLGGPEMAFSVMRDLGLGISNDDIRNIFAS